MFVQELLHSPPLTSVHSTQLLASWCDKSAVCNKEIAKVTLVTYPSILACVQEVSGAAGHG